MTTHRRAMEALNALSVAASGQGEDRYDHAKGLQDAKVTERDLALMPMALATAAALEGKAPTLGDFMYRHKPSGVTMGVIFMRASHLYRENAAEISRYGGAWL